MKPDLKKWIKPAIAALAGVLALLQVIALFAVARAVRSVSISASGGNASVNEDYLAQRIGEELGRQKLLADCRVVALRGIDPGSMPGQEWNYTCDWAFEARPLSVSQDAKATLTVAGQTIPLELRDGVFRGTAHLWLYEDVTELLFTMEEDGVFRTEQYRCGRIQDGLLPSKTRTWTYSVPDLQPDDQGELSLAGLTFRLNPGEIPFEEEIVSARVYVDETDVSAAVADSVAVFGSDARLPVRDGQSYKVDYILKGEIVGKSGVTYRYNFMLFSGDGADLNIGPQGFTMHYKGFSEEKDSSWVY